MYTRRTVASALLATAATAPATVRAQAAPASGERVVDLKDVFPFLDRYLALPATTRDGFELVYSLTSRDGGGLPTLVILDGGRRIPVRVDASGRLDPPQDLALLSRARVSASGPRAGITMDVVPRLALARRIEMTAIANCVQDYEAARRSAGPLAVAAPRLRGLAFAGVSAGEVELAQGRRVALVPERGEGLVVRPGDRTLRGAVAVQFPAVPRRASFAR
jgi:hypothetical protein